MNLILVGYFCAPTGVGQGARNAAKILRDCGVDIQLINIETEVDDPILISEFDQYVAKPLAEAGRIVCFVNADMWSQHVDNNPEIPKDCNSLVGIWSWELEDIPDYFLKATQRLNQVFAVSNWSARVMSKRFGFRVDRLVSLDFRRLLENLSQDARLLDNQLVDFFSNLEIDSKKMSYIYSFFDFSSVMERKNPTAIIKIWNSIHTFFPNHFLILKCLNAEDNQKHYLQDLVSDTPRVKFLWGVLPYSLQLSLVRNAALFVSLHRSEGLGFGPLEAASFDVPVVYTNYGGFCELIPTGHFPVSWEYVLVGEGALPYPKDALWAEPNLEEAKMQVMSAIYQKLNKIWESNSSTRKNIFTKTLNDLELETINKLTSDLED